MPPSTEGTVQRPEDAGVQRGPPGWSVEGESAVIRSQQNVHRGTRPGPNGSQSKEEP